MQTKFQELENGVKTKFLEREEEAHGLTLATLSGHHIFFVGPPGTAKSAMVRWYADHITGTNYFQWLLARFSTPEELFGPVDLSALKAGTYRRITSGKLPEAHYAFLDEIFKGSPAINNMLLSILQERIFHNDGAPIKCPLICAVAASNELPEENEGLQALYDRFLLRYHTGYLRDDAKFYALIYKVAQQQVNAPTINLNDLQAARKEVASIPLSADAATALVELRSSLRKSGLISSDRRFVQVVDVLRAEAWTRGQAEITPDCLEIGAHIFWDKVEDARTVRGLCLQVSNPNLFWAQQNLEAAQEAAARILDGKATTEAGIQVAAQLKKIATDLDARSGGKGRIAQMAAEVRRLNKEVVRKGIGLDV